MKLISLVHESGALIMEGGWADQPAWFAEAYDLYRQELGKWHKETSKSS